MSVLYSALSTRRKLLFSSRMRLHETNHNASVGGTIVEKKCSCYNLYTTEHAKPLKL